MKKIYLAILLTCLSTSCFAAPLLTADDFMPPIQAPEEQREALRTVQHPEEIHTFTSPDSNITTTTARTLQDAINDFIKSHTTTGAKRIGTPDGNYAYVATGLGVYDKSMRNINAVRLSQRAAYLRGLMNAKVELSKMLSDMEIAGMEILANQNDNSNTADSSSTSLGIAMHEKGDSNVAAVLKGYVTYDIFDDGEGTVYVTIVSTPKTMGKYSRPVNDTLLADNVRDGMNAILAEIQSGVVPPVGGRIVDVPNTGEIAFVGFGSALVQRASNPAMRANLRINAGKIAVMRAERELCGIITGDKVNGQASYRESLKQEFTEDFTAIEAVDPMNNLVSSNDLEQVNNAKSNFSHIQNFNEAITTAARGILPPGVNRSSWFDDEGVWAYAVAIYVPSITNRAASDAQTMRDSQILQPVQTEQEIKKRQEQERLIQGPMYNDSGKFKPGVTGTIKQNL